MFGRCRTTWVSAPETVSLHPSQASDGPGQNNSTFLELCKSVTPPCILNPFLFNGHLQTWWTAFCKDDSPIHYKRRIFDSVDAHYPGTFAVDFVVSPPTDKSGEGADDTLPPRTAKFSDDDWEIFVRSQADAQEKRPLLIVLHGLSGGSHEQYIRHVLHPMIKEGWDAFVVNARGCAQHKITTPLLFNARATWDVHQMVDWARETWPNRRLFGIGFSLGANILVNYLGEAGDSCPFDAAVVISNPWNLEISNMALQRTIFGRKIYSPVMAEGLRGLFERNREMMLQIPGLVEEKAMGCKLLHEWDREVQTVSWGYPTERSYYRDASSAEAIVAIRIPTLCIQAEDDPVVTDEAIGHEEIRVNPYIVLASTSGGGHLSWFELGGDRWYSRAAFAVLNKLWKETRGCVTPDNLKICSVRGVCDRRPLTYDPLRRKLFVQE